MSKLVLQLPVNYSEQEIIDFLNEHDLIHVKRHDDYIIRKGDALRTNKGITARVMEVEKNEVGEVFIIIANKALNIDEMYLKFLGVKYSKEELDALEIKCPQCNSTEFDTMECAECGYSNFKTY